MAKAIKIEDRTDQFIQVYKKLKVSGLMPRHNKLINIMDIKSVSTISEMLARRQNISPRSWKLFKEYFSLTFEEEKDQVARLEDRVKALEKKVKQLTEILAFQNKPHKAKRNK